MEHSLRKVYKQIRALSATSPDIIAWDPDKGHIFRADDHSKCYHFECPGEGATAIELLQQRGYIEYVTNCYFFCLTFKGLHPYQTQWEYVKTFLLKSVLVPIVISIVASIITAWLYLKLNL